MIAAAERPLDQYRAAQRSGDPRQLRAKAAVLVASGDGPASEAFHSALCVLLHHGEFALVKDAIERAITADDDRASASLLPLLAHVHQRLQDLGRADELFQQCAQRGLLTGRNAFLARTVDAVAFAAAYEADDQDAVLARARRYVDSCDTPSSEVFHAALCVLMSRGDVAPARQAIEKALASDVDGCSGLLLPLLAYAHQLMRELRTAHALLEQCLQRGLLIGRNAFLARTVDAVAFAAAYESDDRGAVLVAARRFVASCDDPASETFHTAVCALLSNGDVAGAKQAIESALTADYAGCVRLLLPVLAHAYQRQYDFETAHALFQVCRRLGLLEGRNAVLARTAIDVAFAVAELATYRALTAVERDYDVPSFVSGSLAGRALYDAAFADARAYAERSAPGLLTRAPGSEARMPDFIVAGSAKCGTTFLYDLICASQSVWNRAPKEIHYFTAMERFGETFYSRFFELCPDGLLCGEASPDYLDNCNDERPIDVRIQTSCPSTKIVVVLRDPALRAISWYNQMTTNDAARGGRPGSRRLADLTMDQLQAYRNGNSLTTGLFIYPLRRFLQTFGRDRLLVVSFAELLDVGRVSAKVSAFLEIEPPAIGSVPLRQNSGSHDRPSSALYDALREYYRESLAALDNEFGIRL